MESPNQPNLFPTLDKPTAPALCFAWHLVSFRSTGTRTFWTKATKRRFSLPPLGRIDDNILQNNSAFCKLPSNFFDFLTFFSFKRHLLVSVRRVHRRAPFRRPHGVVWGPRDASRLQLPVVRLTCQRGNMAMINPTNSDVCSGLILVN